MKCRDLVKALRLAPSLVLLCTCQHHPSGYQVVLAARNLPAGTVIHAADVKISEVGIDHPDVAFENGGLTDDRARVIGHTTKVDIPEGYSVSINQIDP